MQKSNLLSPGYESGASPAMLIERGAGGRTRTGTPQGHGILSAGRLPISPRPHTVI